MKNRIITFLVTALILLGLTGCIGPDKSATRIPTPWGAAIFPKDEGIKFKRFELDPKTGKIVVEDWESNADASSVLGAAAAANAETTRTLAETTKAIVDRTVRQP